MWPGTSCPWQCVQRSRAPTAGLTRWRCPSFQLRFPFQRLPTAQGIHANGPALVKWKLHEHFWSARAKTQLIKSKLCEIRLEYINNVSLCKSLVFFLVLFKVNTNVCEGAHSLRSFVLCANSNVKWVAKAGVLKHLAAPLIVK